VRASRGRVANQSGAAWEQQIIALAHLWGWTVASFRSVRVQRRDGSSYFATPVQADGAGWPDLVLVRGDRLLFRELKTDRAVTRRAQREWLSRLAATGADVGVWRPRGWDQIVVELRRGRVV